MQCSLPDCGKTARTRGWCGAHYKQWRVYGDPLGRVLERNIDKLCSRGCGKSAEARGLCHSHYNAAYDCENPERTKARAQRNYSRHTESYKQRATGWRRDNPGKVRIITLNASSRRKHQAQGTLTDEDWQTILASTENRCAYCWEPVAALEADHVVPLSRGGHTTADNILPACRSCNASKSNHPLEEWLVEYNYDYAVP